MATRSRAPDIPASNLIPLGDPTQQSRTSRRSRFTESGAEDGNTPADSVYEEEMDGGDGADVEEEAEDDDDDFDDGNSGLRVFMRLSNVVAHLTVCVLLLAIMAQFMAKRKTWVKGLSPLSTTLIVLLSLDICLDIQSAVRFRKQWLGVLVLLRLTCGIGYLAVFMVYVAMGHVFTAGYTYWGLESGYAGPVVYLFLWLIGVWNLLHTALHRHQVGRDIRRYVSGIRSRTGRDLPHAARMPRRRASRQENRRSRLRGGRGVGWMRQPEPSRSRREVDVEATGSRRAAGPVQRENSIALEERHADSKTSSVVSSSPQSEGSGIDAGQGDREPPGAGSDVGYGAKTVNDDAA